MLIQSHAGYIELIPAIPAAWKNHGKVKGLRARGNFTVDMEWKNGKITGYFITSSSPRKVKIKVNGVIKEIMAKKV
jgi:alpha-L-fucosidase 2